MPTINPNRLSVAVMLAVHKALQFPRDLMRAVAFHNAATELSRPHQGAAEAERRRSRNADAS